MWSSASASSLLTGRNDAFPKRPARLAKGKLRLDIPFNTALELLTSKDDGTAEDFIGLERFGPLRFNWSVESEDLDGPKPEHIPVSPLDVDGDPSGPKRSSEGLKKKLERDERRVLKKSSSRKLSVPDLTAEEVEIMKSPSEKPTVASDLMEALRFAVKREDLEDGPSKRRLPDAILPAEGRRRSATGATVPRRGSKQSAADPRRGSKQSAASRRTSAASRRSATGEELGEMGRDSVTSLSSALSESSSAKGVVRPGRAGGRPSKKATTVTLPAPRIPARRLLMPKSAGRNGEHRCEAWLARSSGLPLSVLQQSLSFFKKYVPEYDGRNLFDVKFDMKNFTTVLCDMAGVESVDQLDRRFVSEAFRQADFDRNGGIDCVEFVLWFSAFGFAQYFCVQKEDLPQRDLARKLGVDYIELERYKQAFDKYDEDGSGAIDIDEFECLLTDLLKVPAGHSLSAERVMVLWRDADRDGEGELNLEAFCGFFKRHFEEPENSISDYYRSIRRIPTAQMML